jgi:outer membrane biosynthesis protein TonB
VVICVQNFPRWAHRAAVPRPQTVKVEKGMAFRELQVMQAAYELLSPLDPTAQQRVMAWLSAALADTNGAPVAVAEPAAEVPAENAPGNGVVEVTAEHTPMVPEVETAAPAVEPVVAAEPEGAVEPEPVAEPAPEPRPKRGRSAKATGRRAAKATTSAAAAEPAQRAPGRQGDRPSGEQFRTDLAAAGSFKALAEKYGKSIGTIGNWANQLREQGYDIPGGRQKKA